MARDPLRILSVIRRHAVEQARQALGVCARAEAQAEERIDTLDQTIERDREAARSANLGHQFFEMSTIWLQTIKAERGIAVEHLTVSVSRSVAARDTVATARTAAEAVKTLIAEHAALAETEVNRRLQHALDDMTRPRIGRRRPISE